MCGGNAVGYPACNDRAGPILLVFSSEVNCKRAEARYLSLRLRASCSSFLDQVMVVRNRRERRSDKRDGRSQSGPTLFDLEECASPTGTVSSPDLHNFRPVEPINILDQAFEDELPDCLWSEAVALDLKHRPQTLNAPSGTVRRSEVRSIENQRADSSLTTLFFKQFSETLAPGVHRTRSLAVFPTVSSVKL